MEFSSSEKSTWTDERGVPVPGAWETEASREKKDWRRSKGDNVSWETLSVNTGGAGERRVEGRRG